MEFIKSLFIPTKMNRHRYMSGLVAAIIFFLAAFILTVPSSARIEKEKYELADAFEVSFLTDIPNTEENEKILTLKEYGCKVTDGFLECENEEDLKPSEPMIVSYIVEVPQKDGSIFEVTRNVYFVFDLYDKANNAKPNYNIDVDFDDLERKENEVNYLVLFHKDQMIRKIQPGLDKNGNKFPSYSHYASYTTHGISFNELGKTPSEAGKYLGHLFIDAYVPFFKNKQLFESVFFIFLMSLMIVTIVWLISRTNGRLKTYKEYYNIASICVIPIVLIFFIIFWFVPIYTHSSLLMWLNSAFALYYLFTIFRLNNLPEII